MYTHALSLALVFRRPTTDEVCLPLSAAAERAYGVFADTAPRWLPLRTQTLLVRRNALGHVTDAALRRELNGVVLAFTLRYEYEPSQLLIRWSTDTAELTLAGEAQFDSLSPKTCLVKYRVSLDLPALDDALDRELVAGASHVVRDLHDHLLASRSTAGSEERASRPC